MIPSLGVPPIETLSFFHHEDGFVDRRRSATSSVLAALRDTAAGKEIPRKVVSSRYGKGLNSLQHAQALRLADSLEDYLVALN
jgi:hypothetical protein